MRLLTTIIAILATAATEFISFDLGYDDGSRSMNFIACSDGGNGLETRYGWETEGQIPSFPYIGGSIAIVGETLLFVAPATRNLQWSDSPHARMSETAMNKLTNGQAVQLGRIDAQVEVPENAPNACGQ
ncbi:hypothetical protein LTR78_001211 [Recurvomyces mirabilis]|uniref:Uncharacterized protein n=1 Tax=Recurvomyces mirabilis TaxID=574656 RepID=A0AAE0WV59_9PEZI|nr:hypothetical protein LTR78_001211 [Recurvomyces mirabilis]KAK5161187.1 hypothetical protein LTS14_000983 [Recurvomyces mirabilis]